LRTVPPKTALALSIALLSFACGMLLFVGIRMGSPALLVGLAFFCTVPGLGLIPGLSTRLGDEGVSQIGLKGRTTLRWDAVRNVQVLNGRVLRLHGDNAHVDIPLLFFGNPDAAMSFIAGKLGRNVTLSK
jgi:hypothetical protein